MATEKTTKSQQLGKALFIAAGMMTFGLVFFIGIVILAVHFAGKAPQ